MTTASNRFLNRLTKCNSGEDLGISAPNFKHAQQNYDCIKFGNRHGSISFGHIHQKGDKTSSALLQGSDGRHFITLDETDRSTTQISPGKLNIRSGIDAEQEDETMVLHAENGSIIITAQNGDITFIGDSINFHAVGAEGKGHVTITGSESVTVDAKKVLINAKSMYKIATSGTGEIVANSLLKMYGSLIKGVTDGCALKDGKHGDIAYQKLNTIL